MDTERNHSVIEMDVFSQKGLREILTKLDGKKVNFMVEHMVAGLAHFPQNPMLWNYFLDRFYRLLGEPGIFVFHTPLTQSLPNIAMTLRWLDGIKAKYAGVIDLQYQEDFLQTTTDKYMVVNVRLQKNKGAPDKLDYKLPKK